MAEGAGGTFDMTETRHTVQITIRQARPEDAPLLAQAEREIAQTPGMLVSQPNELSDAQFLAMIDKLASGKNGIYLVAECDGAIVGHAFLEPLHLKAISHVANLTVAVHQGWQGKGIGSLLLKRLIDWAKASENIEKIELSVRASNARAIGLYEKMGFTMEGRLKNRIKIGPDQYIDDILMALFVK